MTTAPRALTLTSTLALILTLAAGAVPAAAAPASAPGAPGASGASVACEHLGVGTGDGQGREHGGMPAACPGDRTASVLYFQDGHEIMPVAQDDGERGGVARLATVVDEQRALHPEAALAFGGDLAGGTLFGGIYRGAPMVDAFNEIGVDVASFGQHDFDFGAQHTRDLVAASAFPWVNSNLVHADDEPFLPGFPTHIQSVNGVEVGFLGLTGGMGSTSTVGEILQRDTVEAATDAVARLEAEGADVVVALTQIDLDENVALLEAVPGIDAAFREENSYVSASEVTTLEDGRLILAPEGNYGSVLRLDIAPRGNDFTITYDEIQVDETVAEDPELAALATGYQDDLEAQLAAPIGTAPAYLDRPAVRLIAADALRAYDDADFAIFNNGGARADIPGPQVTLRDAYSVMPFGNVVVEVEVTGAQLEAALESASERMIPSGFTYTIDTEATGDARVSELRTMDGAAVDPAATYTLATTNYVAASNPALAGSATLHRVVDVQALIDHIVATGTLTAPEPRVTVLP